MSNLKQILLSKGIDPKQQQYLELERLGKAAQAAIRALQEAEQRLTHSKTKNMRLELVYRCIESCVAPYTNRIKR